LDGAISKYITSCSCDITLNRNAGELIVGEGRITNRSYGVWDGKAGELVAREGTVTNRNDGIRDCKTGELVAVEGIATNSSYGVAANSTRNNELSGTGGVRVVVAFVVVIICNSART
jgi:hypothetical protein